MARSEATREDVMSFSGEEESSFGTVPAGKYLIRTSAKADHTSAGRPFVKLEDTIVKDTNGGTYKNRKIFNGIYLVGNDDGKTETLKGMLQSTFKAFTGVPFKGSGTAEELAVLIAKEVNGKSAVAQVAVESPSDEDREERGWTDKNKVQRYLSAKNWKDDEGGL